MTVIAPRSSLAWLTMCVALAGCTPAEPSYLSTMPADSTYLSTMATVSMTIMGQPFVLWIAADDASRRRGLMFTAIEEMAPLANGTERGMIFVFSDERYLSFWMKDTIIPLDIAFINSGGTVTAIHTMTPLDTGLGKYTSNAPAQYAIEVNAHVFGRLALDVGDLIIIPNAVLNLSP